MFEFLKHKPKEEELIDDDNIPDEACVCNVDVIISKNGTIRCDFLDADGNPLYYQQPDRIVLSLQTSIEEFLHTRLAKAMELTDEQVATWHEKTENLVKAKDDLPATHAYQNLIKETDDTTFGREFG